MHTLKRPFRWRCSKPHQHIAQETSALCDSIVTARHNTTNRRTRHTKCMRSGYPVHNGAACSASNLARILIVTLWRMREQTCDCRTISEPKGTTYASTDIQAAAVPRYTCTNEPFAAGPMVIHWSVQQDGSWRNPLPRWAQSQLHQLAVSVSQYRKSCMR